ncbi:MAG: PKD domain-containing protein [Bacteroidales bacterium]
MKKIVSNKISLLICLVLFSISIFSQQYNVQVSGYIYTLDSVSPVSEHLVEVEVDYSGFVDFFYMYTDANGYYFLDSIFVNGSGTISAKTFDCDGQPHQQQDFFSPANNIFTFDFYICTDTTAGCQALFGYEVLLGTFYDVLFIDESIGNYDYWQWDFGDGTTSSDLNPVHYYENPGIYNVCLSIWSNEFTCDDVYCENIEVFNDTSNCENWFTYASYDNLSFDFTGFSTPEAISYFWDLGDGNTKSGQEISHTYSISINDVVPVTLSTLHFDPISLDSCIAVSQQWIFVGNSSSCVADYLFYQDSSDFLSFHFFDNSSGQISNYLWDFGDGSFSELQNPVHSFLGPGLYPVCLTIFSDSSGISCTDLFCLDISIDYELSAQFEVYLDTLSGLINQYQFFDISSGEPAFWQWSFGDGNTSSAQNPLHQYENSGQFEICLDVSRLFANGNFYSDSFCSALETPNYFDVGGQVFIDDIPMNNFNGDTTVIDTGMAYLYRKYNDIIIPVDTNVFYEYGYYWFTDVREGVYLVKTGLCSGSENYLQVVPAYHENSFYWNEADPLLLNSDQFDVSVNLPALKSIGPGPGSISGSIVISGSKISLDVELSDILIILFNEYMEPVSFRFTNELGQFNFDNLPLGEYIIYAESTGLFTVPSQVNLDGSNVSISGVIIELFQQAVSVNEQKFINFEMGYFYPNPVVDNIHLNLNSNEKVIIKATVYEITGRKIMESDIHLDRETKTWIISTAGFPQGLYIVSFVSEKSNVPQIRKFVK